MKIPEKPKGFGDTVEKVIKITGLNRLAPKGCGCKKRKEALNKASPYKK